MEIALDDYEADCLPLDVWKALESRICKDTDFTEEYSARHLLEEEKTTEFYAFNIVGASMSVAFVAIIAGLFLGLLTLDVMDLQIIQRASRDPDERMYAKALQPIVKERHRVLVTLLLLNALAYEALPIFLDALVPTWMAILLSVTVVMVFGEILPSGIFMGPNQLYLGYRTIPLMRFFLFIMAPCAIPLAWLLDYITSEGAEVQESDDFYNRDELSALVRIQHETLERQRRIGGSARMSRVVVKHKPDWQKPDSWSAHKAEILKRAGENDINDDEEAAVLEQQLMPPLHRREVNMVEGALRMKTRLAMDIYTPVSQLYAVPDITILDKSNITTIYGHGYSRVPVYHYNEADPTDPTSIMGFLITRQLMLIDWDDDRELSTLPLQRPICVSPRMNLVDLFDVLQKNGPLMTFVCARPDLANRALKAEKPIPVEAGLLGIVTLVDVMESILQDRIYDESDIRDRDRAVATLTQWATSILQDFILKKARRKMMQRHGSARSVSSGSRQPVSPKKACATVNGDSEANHDSSDPKAPERPNEMTPLL